MDWFQLYQDMFKTHITMQENLWKSWEEAVGNLSLPQTRQTWEQMVALWEQSIQNLLTTQKRWLQPWAENAASAVQDKASAEEYQKALKRFIDTWEQTQQALWKNWFALVKNAHPESWQSGVQETAQQSLREWNEQIQQMMQMQAEWSEKWFQIFQSAGGK